MYNNSNRVQVYLEDGRFGEMQICPPRESHQEDQVMKQRRVMEKVTMGMGIRISRFSQPSERCPPLAVLATVSSCGLCFKLEASPSPPQEQLSLLYSSCLRGNKVILLLYGTS